MENTSKRQWVFVVFFKKGRKTAPVRECHTSIVRFSIYIFSAGRGGGSVNNRQQEAGEWLPELGWEHAVRLKTITKSLGLRTIPNIYTADS